MNFVAIDFETANNKQRVSACSVGIAVVREGKVIDEEYLDELICPPPPLNFEWDHHVELHHINELDVVNKPNFKEHWPQIANRIGNNIIVAHNAPETDISILKACIEHYKLEKPRYKYVCTCEMSEKLLPELPDHKIKTVADRLGVVFEEKRLHNALYDARVCAEIAIRLFRLSVDGFDKFTRELYETKPAKSDFSVLNWPFQAREGTLVTFTYTKKGISKVHNVECKRVEEDKYLRAIEDKIPKQFLLSGISEVRPWKRPNA
jgi:DNA polymerase-3 subunit epsilon